MNDIFEYYTLTLTAKSPVFVGNGQSVSKKEFCFVPEQDVIRFMDMKKLIDYLVQSDRNLELFEKFMIDDMSLKKAGQFGTRYGEDCFANGLNAFLSLIGMENSDRKKFMLYEISNDGVFERNKTLCEINCFMRGTDGRAYIPGSSVKGMLRTALIQHLIRQNGDILPDESNIYKEEQNLNRALIHTLSLNDKGDAMNSIMRGISISDSEPIPNECLTVCRKVDVSPKNERGQINTARECIKPYTEVVFHIKVDKRYFRPVGIKTDFQQLFQEMVTAFDDEYREFYLSRFPEIEANKKDFHNDFLVLGGGSGYFGKNIIYARFGFYGGLKRVSKYMMEKDLNKQGKPKSKDGKLKNPNDSAIHRISPHMIKLTKYRGELYHMGICDVTLERKSTE